MEIKRYVYGKMKCHLIIWVIVLYICRQKLVILIGTICLEVKLHSRHVSNYVCMKYTNNRKNETDIIINFGRETRLFKSQVLPFSKEVALGLDKEFADAIDEFFKEYPLYKLPDGTIEIISGVFDEVESSNVAFKKVMNLLVFIFQHIDNLKDDELTM